MKVLRRRSHYFQDILQKAFACSKSTIERQQKGVKHVQN